MQPLDQTAAAAEGLTLVGEPILYPNEMQDFSPIVAKINTLEESEAICHTNGVSQQNGAKPQRVYKRLKGFPLSTNKIKRLLFVQRYI